MSSTITLSIADTGIFRNVNPSKCPYRIQVLQRARAIIPFPNFGHPDTHRPIGQYTIIEKLPSS